MFKNYIKNNKIQGKNISIINGKVRCFDKSADEMFADVGYRKDEWYSNYYEDMNGNTIHFLKRKGGNTIKFYESPDSDQEINMQVLQAIIKKCEELDWL